MNITVSIDFLKNHPSDNGPSILTSDWGDEPQGTTPS